MVPEMFVGIVGNFGFSMRPQAVPTAGGEIGRCPHGIRLALCWTLRWYENI